jgi:hypothetical protein
MSLPSEAGTSFINWAQMSRLFTWGQRPFPITALQIKITVMDNVQRIDHSINIQSSWTFTSYLLTHSLALWASSFSNTLSSASPETCLDWATLSGPHIPASIALQVIGTCKPSRHTLFIMVFTFLPCKLTSSAQTRSWCLPFNLNAELWLLCLFLGT